MKLTNKQKSIIWKSLNLNEDFFDDLEDNELIDEPNHDFFNEPFDDTDYTYNIQFIIYMYPFIKKYNNNRREKCSYYFEDPNYEHKETMKSGFLSMIKVLNYILQATHIVTDYSKPKLCSSYEKIIKAFPFMNNGPSNKFENFISGEHFITLKTSINLSRRKNEHNITKLFYSFWRLKQIYDKLVTTIKPNKYRFNEYVGIRVYNNNPYKHSKGASLMPWGVKLDKFALDIINFLNSKDETDE